MNDPPKLACLLFIHTKQNKQSDCFDLAGSSCRAWGIAPFPPGNLRCCGYSVSCHLLYGPPYRRSGMCMIWVVGCFRFPDREVGQFPMAYVVRKPGCNLSETGVMDFVGKQVWYTCEWNWVDQLCWMIKLLNWWDYWNEQVAPYKRIRKVAFIASIPKNPSGKILRKDLIKLATSKLWTTLLLYQYDAFMALFP